jgi:hypothetical protein
MPTPTKILGLDRAVLVLRVVGRRVLLASEFGSASGESVFFSDASCSGVRRTIHTGLPRHSTVSFSPGLRR